MMRQRGFVLLSIILTMSLLAMLALWLNHENGMRITRFTAQANSDRARYAAEAV
jgi:Tfp pilus assembly protein PilX